MLKYADVLNAPVGRLGSAVDDWSQMAVRLKVLAEEAHDGLRAHAETARWAGVNASVTREFVRRTVKEFADAEKEAAGVHRLLLDAYTEFKRAKDGLQAVLDGARRGGIVVDAHGRVAAREPLADDTAARHDPGLDFPKALKAQNANVAAWQQKVDALVAACGAADEALRAALTANIPDAHDFTAPRYASLDDEEAARAVDLAKRVTGEGGTARNVDELRQLQTLLDANARDPEFSTAFYQRLGPQGALDFYARLSLDATGLGPAGLDRAAMVRHVQDDLGPMLGLATNPGTTGHLPSRWTADLMRAGRRPIDVGDLAGPGARVYGYQALGALLRHGTYDKVFLLPVARDMAGFERQHPNLFERAVPPVPGLSLNLDPAGGRGFDPLTGLLSAMANNPASSAQFFNEPLRADTDGDGLVTTHDAAVRTPSGTPLTMIDHLLDKPPTADLHDATPDARTPYQSALGNALEAAVTGRVPGSAGGAGVRSVEHTGVMASVMEQVVAKIGGDPSLILGDGDAPGKLEGLSGHLGNMAAEYMPDLQAVSENGAMQAKPYGVLAEFDKGQMAHFLGAVAQDPEAYGAITAAQQAYTTLLVRDVFAHPENHGADVGDAVQNAVHPGGEIAGMMAEARVQAIHEKHAADDAEFNKATEDKVGWANRIIDAVGGKYIELLPIGGDAVDWLKEDITGSLVDGAQRDSSDEAAQEAAGAYSKAEVKAKHSARDAVGAAGRSAGLPERDVREYQGVASIGTATAYSAGRDLAAAPIGPGK
ncbi:hypothetical protein [Streptomyces sp. NPDC056670]|uniref:hypothetical protein n=1 Tax=Streptomyces sp. NPDC056670 TaxID=3345904 RepID=UPI0036B16DD6